MLLQVQNLKKSYASGDSTVDALKGVSLKIEAGQFVSIMGPSGSGKSTLLHLMGGLDRPSFGKVILNDEAIENLSDDDLSKFRRRKLGFIFQFFNLLPTLTALENVALPKLLDSKPMREIEPKAKELLKMMGLGKRMDHRPDQLSGGEMQRVAIARALVSDPLLILADEPTGNLDSKTGDSVLTLLSDMVREQGQTIVMVTHDLNAASYGTRLITLRDGLVETDRSVPKQKSSDRELPPPGMERRLDV
jgi:putative ABC transport system ATP-binding protein